MRRSNDLYSTLAKLFKKEFRNKLYYLDKSDSYIRNI